MIRAPLLKASAIAGLALGLAACGQSPEQASPAAVPVVVTNGTATVKVVSNRPDLISGGDVLVEVILDSATTINDLVLLRNGVEVTTQLEATDDPLRYLGTITGLQVGENVIAANIGNSLTLKNHPIGGPVFTGRQVEPWVCQGSAVDSQCNQPVETELLYRSSDSSQTGLLAYDPNNPPSDVAMTTTDNGETVPFIVRKESGYQARDKYVIFTLFKEGEPWTPAQPQSQWNGRLLVTHGGNCRGHHTVNEPRTEDYAGTIPPNAAIASSYITGLGLGWAVLSTSQLNLGHNCNLSYQAESLMMAKERFIEQYGELRYTVGTGCSGGAITQNMIANAYPGLYQGLLTTCTYPDVMSTATQFADYHILLRYFADPARHGGQIWNIAQENIVMDHPNGNVNATAADTALFSEAVNPESACNGVSAAERFNQTTNTGGVRCDVLTFMLNLVGRRQESAWLQMEHDLGYGFAGYPLGNEGVQYGLVPLQNGMITPMQFLELNTRVGSLDANLNIKPERLVPDQPALPNAYRTGILNTAVNINTVPIINLTGPDPGIAHDSVHAYWLRHRLDREFGHHDNHVMWGGPTPLIGDANFMNMSLIAMAQWLDAIEADTSADPLADKIVANKPSDLTDKCSNGSGVFVSDQMCDDTQMMVYGTPRTAAGNGPHGDQIQCVLRPFDRTDNYGAGNFVFQEADWQRLETTFATGVCDFDQKPLQWQPTITWLNYQDDNGDTVTGGEQMSPADFPQGWGSPSFANTWEPGWQI